VSKGGTFGLACWDNIIRWEEGKLSSEGRQNMFGVV
jgi:hypothetical protein